MTTTANFLTGNARLAVDGYSNTDAADEEGYIWEPIKLINPLATTADADLRTAKKTIDELLEKARRWKANNLEPDPVWLYWQSEGEDAKRSLVVDGSSEITGSEFDSPLLGVFGLELHVAIKRGKYWESESGTSIINLTMGENEVWSIGNAGGTAAQRITYLRINETSASINIRKAWLGIRPTYRGTANYVPLWEAELGVGGVDSSTVSDGNASGGQCILTTFATTPTLDYRVQIELQDVISSNYDDMVGRYLVLGRMRVDSGNTQVFVQLRTGWATAGTVVGSTYLDGVAAYDLYELGEVQIPLMGNRDGQGSLISRMKQFKFSVYAERLSAAGSLRIDYLYLVPSEHLITFLDDQTNSVPYIYAYTDQDNAQYAFGEDGGNEIKSISTSFHNWEYPVGGGVMVIAVVGTAFGVSHEIGREYSVYSEVIPRWISYR